MVTHAADNVSGQQIALQRGLAQPLHAQRTLVQQRAHRLGHAHLRQLQHAPYAGNGFQTAMVAAVAALAVGIDLSMADLHQAAAASMQQASVGDNPGADVMIDDHLNDIPGAARGAEQRFRHSPGADVMLNVDRHPGMVGQHIAQRHIFDILIKRHAMNNAIFGINNTRHRHGDGGEPFQLLLVANKEPIDMINNTGQKRRAVGEGQLQLILHHQLTA